MLPSQTGQNVSVVYVRKEHAKQAKSALEDAQLLDKNFRMVPIAASAAAVPDDTLSILSSGEYSKNEIIIALPVVESFFTTSNEFQLLPSSSDESTPSSSSLSGIILGQGMQVCPYSTKVMGKQQRRNNNNNNKVPVSTSSSGGTSSRPDCQLTLVQQAIIWTVETLADKTVSNNHNSSLIILDRIKALDRKVCPLKLETFGDDRTVVIPPDAFQEGSDDFWNLLQQALLLLLQDNEEASPWPSTNTKTTTIATEDIQHEFWRQLVAVHGSQRIVRRGTIDIDSRIRQSGHRLIFPYCDNNNDNTTTSTTVNGIIPKSTGPGSPGWIRVTEQGIRQSFDMCRVMFSRGNISEKIRFGKLVKQDERVLDLYAGIGYYTLPALIHGKAKHVVACEWNEHALEALRYNVQDNGLLERVTIFPGDCRVTAKEHQLVNMFDRVSLGLLPSSEGGWETAVQALKHDTGGWLHVHGNVRNAEKDTWTRWLCQRLLDISCREEGVHHHAQSEEWIILCDHVERVKSFAPTVSHYVADVFVGPPHRHPRSELLTATGKRAGLLLASTSADDEDEDYSIAIIEDNVTVPSCALSPDGVLSQSWMM